MHILLMPLHVSCMMFADMRLPHRAQAHVPCTAGVRKTQKSMQARDRQVGRMPQAPEYTRRPLSSIMRRSNWRNTAAEGEWMVAQTVMPPAASAATAVMTCAPPRV